jgi:hypothetical protein
MAAKLQKTLVLKQNKEALRLPRFPIPSKPAKGSTQSPMTTFGFKNAWSYTRTPSSIITLRCLIKHRFNFIFYLPLIQLLCGTRWRSWLRHCATSQKVAGSIPDGVTGIFHWHNPSGRSMTLGSTQSLTEMSTRNISWGMPIVLKPRSLNLLEPSRPVQVCNAIVLRPIHT